MNQQQECDSMKNEAQRTVYCIARTGSVGGVDWFSAPAGRMAAERFSGDVLFDMEVDAELSPAEITNVADDMAYNEMWLKEGSGCRRVDDGEKPHQGEGKDVDVIETSSLDDEHAACKFQRVYRGVHGLDPMTGEPMNQQQAAQGGSPATLSVEFVSVWSEGEVASDAILDLQSGEVTSIETSDCGAGFENLLHEEVRCPSLGVSAKVEASSADRYFLSDLTMLPLFRGVDA